jgi:hypothetical protein
MMIIFFIFLSPSYSLYWNLTGINFSVNDLNFEAPDQDNLLADQQKEPNGIFPDVPAFLLLSRINLSEVFTIFSCQTLFPQQNPFNLRC